MGYDDWKNMRWEKKGRKKKSLAKSFAFTHKPFEFFGSECKIYWGNAKQL